MHPSDPENEMSEELEASRDLLDSLDREAPALSAEDVMQFARVRRNQRTSTSRGMLWAASIAGLLSAAIVAAAIPGSPVHRALQGLLDSRSDSTQTMPPTAVAGAAAGVSITPDRKLEIIFESSQTGGAIDIVLQATRRATVEVSGGSVGLDVGVGSVTVRNRNVEASYRIVLPEHLPHAVVRVGDRAIFVKDGNSHRVAVDMEGSQGSYRLPFAALPGDE